MAEGRPNLGGVKSTPPKSDLLTLNEAGIDKDLAKEGQPYQKSTGVKNTPVENELPTLEEAGIDKNSGEGGSSSGPTIGRAI